MFMKTRGEFIRKLKITFGNEIIQNLLSFTDNLEVLELNQCDDSENLDLTRLKNLSELIIDCCKKPQKWQRNSLKSIKFVAYKKIRNDVNPFLFEKSLEKLAVIYEAHCNCHLASLPRNFSRNFTFLMTNMKELELCHITEDFLEHAVKTMKQLVSLKSCFNYITPECFDKLAILEKLKTLEVKNTILDDLIKGHKVFLKLNKLKLTFCKIFNPNVCTKFALKFPYLLVFEVARTRSSGTVKMFKTFVDFSVLQEVRYFCYDYKNTFLFPILDRTKEFLTVLAIEHPVALNIEFLLNFPNLKELELFLDTTKIKSVNGLLKNILTKLNKLEKVFFTFKWTEKIDFYIIYLLSDSYNLKLVHLVNILFVGSFVLSKNQTAFEISEINHVNANPTAPFYFLLASNADCLKQSKSNFLKTMNVKLMGSNRKVALEYWKHYYKALKYDYKKMVGKNGIGNPGGYQLRGHYE